MIEDQLAREAIPFSFDEPGSLESAVDQLVAALGDEVRLLGLGEALHGGEEMLILRNRLFQHLVEAHGFSAIAVESSFPRAYVVNQYVAGRGAASYDEIAEAGFSYGFRNLEANRELVEWMRQYNSGAASGSKLRYYGFDSPTSMVNTDSPRQALSFVLDYLAALAPTVYQGYCERIGKLIGDDARWENPAALMDPTQGIGVSADANALRIETEELISELRVRRPELVLASDQDSFEEALHYASVARQLLNYHAELARTTEDRLIRLLGIRDALMADNLAYIEARERGKVLVFAHNSHLQRGQARWQLGPYLNIWWPVGAHLATIFGELYANIGSGVVVSEENGIGEPEVGSLEAVLAATPGPVRFIPTHREQPLTAGETKAIPTRSGSAKNPMYFPLTPRSLSDFDWLVVLNSVTFSRGALPLQQPPTG